MILKNFFEETTFLGGILFYILFTFYFLLNQEYRSFFILLIGLIFIYLITLLIRSFYFRDRPKKVKHKNFLEKIDASSFPSVHAARATILFLFILINFTQNTLFILVSFVLMLLVFLSRIYLKKHFPIDIMGGILLGMVSFYISALLT